MAHRFFEVAPPAVCWYSLSANGFKATPRELSYRAHRGTDGRKETLVVRQLDILAFSQFVLRKVNRVLIRGIHTAFFVLGVPGSVSLTNIVWSHDSARILTRSR